MIAPFRLSRLASSRQVLHGWVITIMCLSSCFIRLLQHVVKFLSSLDLLMNAI